MIPSIPSRHDIPFRRKESFKEKLSDSSMGCSIPSTNFCIESVLTRSRSIWRTRLWMSTTHRFTHNENEFDLGNKKFNYPLSGGVVRKFRHVYCHRSRPRSFLSQRERECEWWNTPFLDGEDAWDVRVDHGSWVSHYPTALRMLEAPDDSTQRPLDNGS